MGTKPETLKDPVIRALSDVLRTMTRRRQLIVAVGDIHGCYPAASRAIEILEQFPLRVVFLGDYVDRGPSSYMTVEALIGASQRNQHWQFVMGNHEHMLLEALRKGMNPSAKLETAEGEYGSIGGIPKEHETFLQSLKPFFESESFLFMHGGISRNCDLPVEEHPIEEIIWTYEINPKWAGKKIVRGHQIVDEPTEQNTHIDLDTGCFHDGYLTLGVLDDESGHLIGWIQVSANGEKIREHWL